MTTQLDRPQAIKVFFFLFLGSHAIAAAIPVVKFAREARTQPQVLAFEIGAILIALLVGLGYAIFIGKNWARLLYSALWGLGIFVACLPLQNPYPSPQNATMFWFTAFLQGVAIGFMFAPSANAWFRKLDI